MVTVQSARRSLVAPGDRRLTHFDGEGRDWTPTARGGDAAGGRATRATRIRPALPDGTSIGEAREATGSH
jgi:hypothetical protein